MLPPKIVHKFKLVLHLMVACGLPKLAIVHTHMYLPQNGIYAYSTKQERNLGISINIITKCLTALQSAKQTGPHLLSSALDCLFIVHVFLVILGNVREQGHNVFLKMWYEYSLSASQAKSFISYLSLILFMLTYSTALLEYVL